MVHDIDETLQSIEPPAAEVDLAELHRKGMRRRWGARVAKGGAGLAIVGAVALGASSLFPSVTVEDDDSLEPTQQPAATVSAEEGEVQSCMQDAGLEYRPVADADVPGAAYTITPATVVNPPLQERHPDLPEEILHADPVELVETYGYWGHELWISAGATVTIRGTLPDDLRGQDHLVEEVLEEGEAMAARGATSDEINEHTDRLIRERKDALSSCLETAYGVEYWDTEQAELVNEVLGRGWAGPFTTAYMTGVESYPLPEDFSACFDQDREQFLARMDDLAVAAGLPERFDDDRRPDRNAAEAAEGPEEGSNAGWTSSYWLEVDPFEVPGFAELVEETREGAVRGAACHRDLQLRARQLEEQHAERYLRSRADELREAGIEVEF